MTTRAEPLGSGWVLSGRKRWTTNASEAALFIVFAKTPSPVTGEDEISAFLVPREASGVNVGPPEDKLGVRASSTADLVLEDVKLRAQDMLGRPGAAGGLAVEALAVGRVGIAAQLVGLAQGALEAAVNYTSTRMQFGVSVASFQAVQFGLARMATDVESARLLTYNAARIVDSGVSALERYRASAMAKLVASEVADRVSAAAVELHGGNGYVRGPGVEKFFRDAKVGAIYEGTTNMQLKAIAGWLLHGRDILGARRGEP